MFNRRQFLKVSVAAAVGAAIDPAWLAANPEGKVYKFGLLAQQIYRMKYSSVDYATLVPVNTQGHGDWIDALG